MPWARSGSGFTAGFEALALALCRELPVRQDVELLRRTDKQLWRRLAFYVNPARGAGECRCFDGLRTVGIDETSLRLGQSYITVVHDLDGRRLLFATEGREHQTVLDFAADLKAYGGQAEESKHVCMDMSAAYTSVGLAFTQAQISYDRFHVIPMANAAMDLVRRDELRDDASALSAALGPHFRKTLKQLMWGMCRNPAGWSRPQPTSLLIRSALRVLGVNGDCYTKRRSVLNVRWLTAHIFFLPTTKCPI